jgi:lysophospholipase L1-like esterase
VALGALVLSGAGLARPAPATTFRFAFGPGDARQGYTEVLPGTPFSTATGFGFEPGTDAPAGGVFFSVAVPEGNYRVTVTLGDAGGPGDTSVFAELRRLMLERVVTRPGQFDTRTFIVNVRRPEIPGGGGVTLKDREKTTEARAWDDRLTLEFSGAHSAVSSLDIAPVDVPTAYLLGDSTVADQPAAPYTSWGQMLTRFLKPGIAVANHSESGESVSGALAARRFDKIWSEMKKGDYLFVQFGHNDMKSEEPGALQTYAANLVRVVGEARRRGGLPVIVTSVSRRTFDPEGRTITNSFKGFTQAARDVAREQGVPVIDLQACSATFYEALGPEVSHQAFATPQEATHHNDYGSYQIAKCVVKGIKDARLGVAAFIVDDFTGFDPRLPDPVGGAARQVAEGGNDPTGFDMAPETRIEVVRAAVDAIPLTLPRGPVAPTWDSLEAAYRVPEWFYEARFGIFIHWGVDGVLFGRRSQRRGLPAVPGELGAPQRRADRQVSRGHALVRQRHRPAVSRSAQTLGRGVLLQSRGRAGSAGFDQHEESGLRPGRIEYADDRFDHRLREDWSAVAGGHSYRRVAGRSPDRQHVGLHERHDGVGPRRDRSRAGRHGQQERQPAAQHLAARGRHDSRGAGGDAPGGRQMAWGQRGCDLRYA